MTKTKTKTKDSFEVIAHSAIAPSPDNPRRTFGEADLAELADSIRRVGVLEPILVRATPDMIKPFEIIAGERRWRACEIAGVETVPAIVKDVSDEEVLEIRIIENLQRKDVHPLDEADGFRHLQDKLGWTNAEIGLRVGKTESFVAVRLKLCGLTDRVREMFDQLTLGHLLEIAKFPAADQFDVAKLALEDWRGTSTVYPLAKFVSRIQEFHLLALAKAPFSVKSAELREDGLQCVKCPDRTKAQGVLFEETYDKDHCLNRECWAGKLAAHVKLERRSIAAEKLGADAAPKLIEKAAAEVPTISSRYYVSDRDVFGKERYELLEKNESCDHAELAVYNVKDGERPGQTARICRHPTCPTHRPSRASRSVSEGSDSDAAEAEREAKRIRKEEIFDSTVAAAVRMKVLALCIKNLDKHEDFDMYAVDAVVASRLWTLARDHSDDYAAATKLLELGDIYTYKYGDKLQHLDKFRAMPETRIAEIVFLLVHGRDGEISEHNRSWNGQKPIKDLAERFGLDYAKFDAEERLAQAPAKLKDLYRSYLHEIEAGHAPPVPRPYSSKWKPED